MTTNATTSQPVTPVEEVVAEALRGPWEAVLAYSTGEVTTLDEIDGNYIGDLDDVRVEIVRRSAAPTGPDADGEKRLPGTYNADDLMVEFDGFEDLDEVTARWVQAQAMAAGLNAAATATR